MSPSIILLPFWNRVNVNKYSLRLLGVSAYMAGGWEMGRTEAWESIVYFTSRLDSIRCLQIKLESCKMLRRGWLHLTDIKGEKICIRHHLPSSSLCTRKNEELRMTTSQQGGKGRSSWVKRVSILIRIFSPVSGEKLHPRPQSIWEAVLCLGLGCLSLTGFPGGKWGSEWGDESNTFPG